MDVQVPLQPNHSVLWFPASLYCGEVRDVSKHVKHIKDTNLMSLRPSHPNIHSLTSQVKRTVMNTAVPGTDVPNLNLAISDEPPKNMCQCLLYERSKGVNLRERTQERMCTYMMLVATKFNLRLITESGCRASELAR
jgi:hypothetical protein